MIGLRFIALLGTYLFLNSTLAQGFINNGAYVVFNDGGNVVINSSGSYTNLSNGLLKHIGGSNKIWLGGNWQNFGGNSAFFNDGITVVLNGNSQSIQGRDTTRFFNLTIAGSGVKTLESACQVGGQNNPTGRLEILNSVLDLNQFSLHITNPDSTAIIANNGYIISEHDAAINLSTIQWYMGNNLQTFVFPFGTSLGAIPFSFKKRTTKAISLTVSTRKTYNTNNTPFAGLSNVAAVNSMNGLYTQNMDVSSSAVLDRWWDITPSDSVQADLTFRYHGSENTTTIAPTGPIGAQHWNGSSWEEIGGSGTGVTSGVGTVTIGGVLTFSPWVLAATSQPLPVSLLDFSSNCIGSQHEIQWSTISEQNNAFFHLESSVDGIHFQPLISVPGAHYHVGKLNYQYGNRQTNSQSLYYRLSQEDLDGKLTLLKTISQPTCTESGAFGYFNSITNEVILKWDKHFEVEQIVISNATGKVLEIIENDVLYDQDTYRINAYNFATGIYFINILNPSNSESIKIPVYR